MKVEFTDDAREQVRVLAALLLLGDSACGGSTSCPGFCDGYPGPQAATLVFQCSQFVAPTVEATGPCTAQAASNPGPNYHGYWGIDVQPTAAGTCTVDVTLADGYRSTTIITFVASYVAGDSCCASGTAFTPTVSQTEIDNPGSGCPGSLAGPDASLWDGAVQLGDASPE